MVPVIGRRTALKIPVVASAAALLTLTQTPRALAAPVRWSPQRAHTWYRAQQWLVGANYIPSNAVNQFEMFQAETFDPSLIQSELRLARLIGINTVRVFLHDQLWTQDRVGFLRRLDQFLGIADRNRIKPLLVLFDSCWDPLPRAGRQLAPQRGIHNSRWAQSPGAERLGDRRYTLVMNDYVRGVLTQFRNDDRVLGWDLWNEPDNPARVYRRVENPDKLDLVAQLLPQVFRWAREVNPSQPLTSGVWEGEWGDAARRTEIAGIQLENSDVITFHSYASPGEFDFRINELSPWQRPLICTEYMARPEGSTIEGILPVAQRRNVGTYTWGLIAGKTQTYLPWDSWDRPYVAEPPREWFHDLLHRGGRPYRDREIHTLRKLTGRLDRAPSRHPDSQWRPRRARIVTR